MRTSFLITHMAPCISWNYNWFIIFDATMQRKCGVNSTLDKAGRQLLSWEKNHRYSGQERRGPGIRWNAGCIESNGFTFIFKILFSTLGNLKAKWKKDSWDNFTDKNTAIVGWPLQHNEELPPTYFPVQFYHVLSLMPCLWKQYSRFSKNFRHEDGSP